MAIKLIDQISSTFAAGSFYYYILNFETLKMEYVDPSIKDLLGIEPHEFELETYFNKLHPEDLMTLHKKEEEAVNFLLNKIPTNEIPLYKVVYLVRLEDSSGNYKTILHQAQATSVSKDGKVQQVIGVHTDISYLRVPFDHQISFISNTRPSYYSILPDISLQILSENFRQLFTTREKEIIRNISEGKTFHEIAAKLLVSPLTINTHKKNILRKSHCSNSNELIAKCIRQGVI